MIVTKLWKARCHTLCWGTLAVVIDIDSEKMLARVDFGDGIPRKAAIGVTEEKVSKGDIVIVHAGVIVSKLTPEGLQEQLKFFEEILGEDVRELATLYNNILKLSQSIKARS